MYKLEKNQYENVGLKKKMLQKGVEWMHQKMTALIVVIDNDDRDKINHYYNYDDDTWY